MKPPLASPLVTTSLFASFCAFYERIAALRLAQAQGRLAAALVQGTEAAPLTGKDMAERMAAQLGHWLHNDAEQMRKNGSTAQIRMHHKAQYLMAALADEILLLEMDWPGKAAWADVLLEARLFGTRLAGGNFYLLEQKLLQVQRPAELHIELALIMLAALQLGFRGVLRGDHLLRQLTDVRARLLHFVDGRRPDPAGQHAFQAAYEQRQSGKTDPRLSPLKPWWQGLTLALACLGLLSMLIWLVLAQACLHGLNTAV